MSGIDPSQRLGAAVRMQAAATRERAPAKAAAGAAAAAGSTSAAGSAAASAAPHRPRTVSAAMAQRIAALAPQDPDRPRKAVRIYLEAELAREFGAALLNDPEFSALVDAVQQRLEEDAQTAGAAAALAALLLAGAIEPA